MRGLLIAFLLLFGGSTVAAAQMTGYFTVIARPLPQDTAMVMTLSDFQSARSGNDFFTGMQMVQYGLTQRWTVGVMFEGQKIFGLPTTYGGVRFNSSVHVFPHDHLLNFTLYGEYEGLNGAALYKMEVAGFGGEDLEEPLRPARRTPVRTFEQRAIVYHDWGRTNLTFNFINETSLDDGENDFGYAWGVFRQAAYPAMAMDAMVPVKSMPPSKTAAPAKDMAGMSSTATGKAPPSASATMDEEKAPPAFSFQRLGYGVEMLGALGNTGQFGFDWQRQQQYVGPVFSYSLSKHWTVHLAPSFGLSEVSDPFMLRMGVGYSIDHLLHRRPPRS